MEHIHDFDKLRIVNTVRQPDGSLNVYYGCTNGYCQAVMKKAYLPHPEKAKLIEFK